MSLKTLEESIREYPNYRLEEVLCEKRKDYSNEAILIAEDELTFRKLKSLNPLEQIDFIKSLGNEHIALMGDKFKDRYPSNLFNIIQTEYIKRGLEEAEWYYLDSNKSIGPLRFSELKRLVEYNTIFPYTFVFKKGLQNWINAGNVPGLFDYIDTNTPPPPPIFQYQSLNNQSSINNDSTENTKLGCGLSLISFLIPIIGVIIFFTEKNEKGKNALALAFVGFLVGFVLYYVFFLSL